MTLDYIMLCYNIILDCDLRYSQDFGVYREQLSRSIVAYVNAARHVVMDTCHLVTIFVSVLVLVDALGAVLWIYLQR